MRLRLYGESAEPRLRSRHLPEQYEKDLTIKVKRHRRDWFQLLLGHDDRNENENREDVICVLICEKQRHEVLKSDNSRLMQRLFFVMVSLMGGAETKVLRSGVVARTVGFQPLAWPVSSVVMMAGLWTSN